MREFRLTNANNEIYSLMDHLLNSPSGLGFDFDTKYSSNILTRRATQRKLSFGTVKGEIVFQSYAEYSEFITFVMAGGLSLYYKPTEAIGEYYAAVDIGSVAKAEIDYKTRLLLTPITFDLLGYWTKDEVVVSGTGETGGAENQPYPFTYPITYGRSLGSSQFMALTLTNNGHAPAPLKITIRGQAINPTWNLGDQQGGLNITIQAGQSVDIDSRETVMAIKSGDTVLDQFKDHTKQNYIYAPVGTSTILIEATDAEVTLYEQYASV